VKKWERALRHILHLFYEQDVRFMNQKAIADACDLSLGSVNPVIKRLHQLGAIEKKPLGFRVTDVGRIVLYWANSRNLAQDITLKISTNLPTREIEKELPRGAVLTAYSAFRVRFEESIGGYKEVHVYADAAQIKRRFGTTPAGTNTIVVMKPDEHLSKVSENEIAPMGQIYADLWQLGTPAKAFVDYLNAKMRVVEMGTLKGIIHRTRERT
jgi:hypothetical protein